MFPVGCGFVVFAVTLPAFVPLIGARVDCATTTDCAVCWWSATIVSDSFRCLTISSRFGEMWRPSTVSVENAEISCLFRWKHKHRYITHFIYYKVLAVSFYWQKLNVTVILIQMPKLQNKLTEYCSRDFVELDSNWLQLPMRPLSMVGNLQIENSRKMMFPHWPPDFV